MIQQRTQFSHGNRHVGLQSIAAKEIIEQAAYRAFLIRRSRHMSGRAEGVLSFLHIGKQRLGERRRDVIEVFAGVLTDAGCDIFQTGPAHTQKTTVPCAGRAR